MAELKVFTVVLLALWGIAYASHKKTKCQVVDALLEAGAHPSDMRDWLCLVYHESEFQYDAVNENTFDYGIFQISRQYWCRGANDYSVCWKINTYGCGVTHSDCSTVFTDSNIANDAECAVKIKKCNDPPHVPGGNGFSMWVAWQTHCQGDLTSNPAYDWTDCY